jgi:hypothetical protein
VQAWSAVARVATVNIPRADDVLFRGSADTGFELVNAPTLNRVHRPFVSMICGRRRARDGHESLAAVVRQPRIFCLISNDADGKVGRIDGGFV